MPAQNELHQTLRAQATEVLVPLIAGREASICIVDAPRGANCGDAAIFLGQLAFLREQFPTAALRFIDYTNNGSEAMRLVGDASLLVFTGGGNFGDLWFQPHAFRLHLLDRYAHVPKLQLPFSNVRKRDISARLIGRQRDFRLCVRDQQSLAFARAHFACETVLCPDVAYCLPAPERAPARCDTLALLRDDKERSASHEQILTRLRALGTSTEVVDWAKDSASLLPALDWRFEHLRNALPYSPLLNRSALWLRERYARARVAFGLALLARGRRVVTDRLHGLILSSLLGIETTAFDTADGKVSAFYDTWLRGTPGLTLASSADALT